MNRGATVVLVAAVLHAAPVSAFESLKTQGGAALHWTARSITYDVQLTPGDPSGELIAAAARRALDTWAHGLETPGLIYGGPGVPVPADARSTVAVVERWDPAHGDGGRTLARTFLVYDTVTGVITSGDILINGDDFTLADDLPGAIDTESVVLHEAGHLLGLDHSCGVPGGAVPSCFDVPDIPPGARLRVLDAAMAPTLAPGVTRHTLGDDDRAGLASLYIARPPGGPRILGLETTCEGTLVRTVSDAVEVRLRYSTGVVDTVDVLQATRDGPRLAPSNIRTATATVDVILLDVDSGAYDAVVAADLSPAAGCDAEPTPSPGGCDCNASGSRSTSALWIVMTLFMLQAALRARSARWAPGLAAALAAIIVVGAASPAHAYRCSRVGVDFGPSLVWDTRQIEWVVSERLTTDLGSSDAVLTELKAAFAAWEGPECSDLRLPFGGQQPGIAAGFQQNSVNENAVLFVRSGWAYDTAVIALTTNAFDTRTGVVFDADIEVNDENFEFVAADEGCSEPAEMMDLRNAMTHEVGHVIGLDHPPLSPRFAETTMFASAPVCETKKRSLEADDIEGLCAIYPANAPFEQCFAPDLPSFVQVDEDEGFGCHHSRVPHGAPLAAWALALAALLLWRWRSATRSNAQRGPTTGDV